MKERAEKMAREQFQLEKQAYEESCRQARERGYTGPFQTFEEFDQLRVVTTPKGS